MAEVLWRCWWTVRVDGASALEVLVDGASTLEVLVDD